MPETPADRVRDAVRRARRQREIARQVSEELAAPSTADSPPAPTGGTPS